MGQVKRGRVGVLIFLRHNIKDGGYNSTNINKQLSPAQNTAALQATSQRRRSVLKRGGAHLPLSLRIPLLRFSKMSFTLFVGTSNL